MTTTEKFSHHTKCENCGSRDNRGVWLNPDDTIHHTYCFGCHEYTAGGEPKPKPKIIKDMIVGEFERLNARKINEDTCKVFDYEVGEYEGRPVQIANYYDKQYNKVAQKLRFPDKSFKWFGDTDKITLFGQQNWRDGGRTIVITEGELDCLSVSQVNNNKYPVVSIPSGTASAKKYIKRELEWLSKFEKIILMFDTDEAGMKASVECANILPVKKCYIAKVQGKDANELLQQGKGQKIIDSIFEAKHYTPQGIIEGVDTKELLLNDDYVESVPYAYDGLNKKLSGIRPKELVLLCGGSGTGKSQVTRELAYDLINKGHKIGYIALEESVKRSVRGLVSLAVNKPIHIPEVRKSIPTEELVKEWEKIKDKVCFYDHFGSSDSEDLLNRIRFMVQGLNCKFIFLDHISIVISGISEGDERRLIDNTMTNLRKLVEEINCGMFVVSHLKRVDSKTGHEDGLQTSLSHLRGSHSLAQLSDAVIGFERNQQSETENNIMTARVLKNRFTGDTGVACDLIWNKDTGRLSEGNFDE